MKHTILLSCCLEVDSMFLKYHYLDIMNLCITLAKSHLTAPHIVPCYIKLAYSVFKGEFVHLGMLVNVFCFIVLYYCSIERSLQS